MELVLAEAEGRRATVSRGNMVDHMKAYEASDNVDRARFNRQVDGAIEKAKKYNFLRLIRNSGDRFEVSPALKLVFSHDQVQALLLTYERIRTPLEGHSPGGDDIQLNPPEPDALDGLDDERESDED
ncbi:hypothetical protein WT05_18205 [Burkholderia stagnalis]|nr:hypothetical protein WT05_18205 [Burkholderia stagnalis]